MGLNNRSFRWLNRSFGYQPVVYALLISLLLATTSIYLPPYPNDFLGDDYKHLQYINTFLDAPWRSVRIFDPFWLGWYYRPLQQFSIFIERLLFGFEPFGYYGVQVGLHALVVAVLFRLCRQWGLGLFATMSAVTLFAIRGHHHDVVSWISSLATIQAALFSILAAGSYLAYRRRPKRRFLVAAVVAGLLALLAHEAGVLLPIFLLLVRTTDSPRRPLARDERLTFALLFLTTAVYIALQLIRPNWTIDLDQTMQSTWPNIFSLREGSLYIAQLFFRFTALSPDRFNWLLGNDNGLILFSAGVSILVTLWYWRGGRVVRLGLLWAGLHLAFIYITLWGNKPEFFAGRHLYIPGLGLAWAVGDGVARLGAWPGGSRRTTRLVIILVLAANLAVQVDRVQQRAQPLADRAQELAVFAAQLKTALPRFEPGDQLFINNFPMEPSFLPAAVSAWYEQPLPYPYPGGGLTDLQAQGEATADTYVFDYDEGVLHDLMPELRTVGKTIFLWGEPPQGQLLLDDGRSLPLEPPPSPLPEIVILDGQRRSAFSSRTSADGWISLAFDAFIPAGSELHLSLGRTRDEPTYRIRVETQAGETAVLFRGRLENEAANSWTELTLPLDPYWGQRITVYLELGGETAGHTGYWANPRMVVVGG